MSTTQILLLGADRRRDDLPRPADRAGCRARACALKAFLSATATGILLFLLFDVLGRDRAGRDRAEARRDWGAVRRLRDAVRPRRGVGPAGPRRLRPLDRGAPQEGRRSAPAPPRTPSSQRALDRVADAGALARAADRDRDRPAQLRRGPRDRPVGGARASSASRSCSSSASGSTTRPRASGSSPRWPASGAAELGASSRSSG